MYQTLKKFFNHKQVDVDPVPSNEPFAPSDLPIDERAVASKLSDLAKLNADAFNRKLYGSPGLNSTFDQVVIDRIRDKEIAELSKHVKASQGGIGQMVRPVPRTDMSSNSIDTYLWTNTLLQQPILMSTDNTPLHSCNHSSG